MIVENTLPHNTRDGCTLGHHQMVNVEIILIICFAAEDEAPYSQQKQDWELTVAHHELLIAKFRLILKKVRKINRPLRYDLNQIPYNYTVEVTDRFNRLDLIDRVPEELLMEICDIVQKAVIKIIPKKKKCKKTKQLSEEALQIAVERREAKAKEKRKDIPI